jgi:hypothetical protein
MFCRSSLPGNGGRESRNLELGHRHGGRMLLSLAVTLAVIGAIAFFYIRAVFRV